MCDIVKDRRASHTSSFSEFATQLLTTHYSPFPPMRFAICNETFQNWPFDKAFRFAADLGYTGPEIAPFTINVNAYEISPTQRSALRKQADEAGLEIIGLHWRLAKA